MAAIIRIFAGYLIYANLLLDRFDFFLPRAFLNILLLTLAIKVDFASPRNGISW